MDKQDFIVKQAARLPLDERKAVVKGILGTIDRDARAKDATERFAQLVPKAEVAMESKYEPTKKANKDAYIRNIIAEEMRKEGYTFTQIGRAMGRHYSSVITMVARAEEMRDGYFGAELKDKYNRFIDSL